MDSYNAPTQECQVRNPYLAGKLANCYWTVAVSALSISAESLSSSLFLYSLPPRKMKPDNRILKQLSGLTAPKCLKTDFFSAELAILI